ncbi:Uncharacterised protein [Candidatus Burarchaeum australiense]|nr:Uncharacterised protein [Candidatus Burarchaeum australiense]
MSPGRVNPVNPAMRAKRAQAFSIDYVLSVCIFLFILLLLLPIWGTVNQQIADSEGRKEMQMAAITGVELLSRSQGNPFNWTNETVTSIGLADEPHVVNATKILELQKVNYPKSKSLLGLNQYNFTLNFTNSRGYLMTSGVARSPAAYYSASTQELLPAISGTGLVWDYYWGHDLPAPEPAHGDARSFQGGIEADAFNAMILNATARNAYSTIIIEQPSILLADANVTGLREFVENGGRVIFEGAGYGGEILIQDMGAAARAIPPATGLMAQKGLLLNKPDAGTGINFQSATWAFASQGDGTDVKIYAADAVNSSLGLIMSWNYGKGSIYYITDANGTAAGEPLPAILNIGGGRLSYGPDFTNSTDVVNIERVVLVNSGYEDWVQMGRMQFVVWK